MLGYLILIGLRAIMLASLIRGFLIDGAVFRCPDHRGRK
jgi:hypothetical protein